MPAPCSPPARKPLLVALALLGTLAAGLTTTGQDEPRPAAAPAGAKTELIPDVFPAETCKTCHSQQDDRPYSKEQLGRMICRMVEYPYFEKQDKHRLAFQSLLEPRGQRIAERLGARKATEIDACVKCHATLPIGIDRIEQLSDEGLAQVTADGVTCMACHGEYQNWVNAHFTPFLTQSGLQSLQSRTKEKQKTQAPQNAWLALTRKDKERDYGMTDLWDPARRAEACASCHIGDAGQGKLLTHAMYAAGHPPLPGFEAATFSDAQPRHWQYLREKAPEQLKRIGSIDPENLEQTQLVAVSGLVALRESMELFADEAARTGDEPIGSQWPDFARYDCSSCHHDLKPTSWRQTRGSAGAPGRPNAPEWPLALVWLGIEASDTGTVAARSQELDRLLEAFHQAVVAQPFGEREAAIAAARAVAEWAGSQIEAIREKPVDRDRARALLARLCTLPARAPDYDSARQIAWAFRAIYQELTPEDRRDAEIRDALDQLNQRLALDLPTQKEQRPIEDSLAERLKVAADYDPRIIQALFNQIAARLR
jgi:hypothetical protein